jgi:hypothetical protein
VSFRRGPSFRHMTTLLMKFKLSRNIDLKESIKNQTDKPCITGNILKLNEVQLSDLELVCGNIEPRRSLGHSLCKLVLFSLPFVSPWFRQGLTPLPTRSSGLLATSPRGPTYSRKPMTRYTRSTEVNLLIRQ